MLGCFFFISVQHQRFMIVSIIIDREEKAKHTYKNFSGIQECDFVDYDRFDGRILLQSLGDLLAFPSNLPTFPTHHPSRIKI